MAYFVSSLLAGPERMEAIARWVDGIADPQIGVELIAFTHDAAYWGRLERLLEKLRCPVSFHGPYIGTEGTAAGGTKEQKFLLESYERVLALAKAYQVRHIVYHYTQGGFDGAKRDLAKAQEWENRRQIRAMAEGLGVELLVENLPCPEGQLPLYTLAEYAGFFADPAAKALVDIGHAHMGGMDLEWFLGQWGSSVRAYHFHNNNGREDQHREIFDGEFDFLAFAKWYHNYTPKADIILEYEPHVALSRRQLIAQLEWLKKNY